jgi:hypothetical protein
LACPWSFSDTLGVGQTCVTTVRLLGVFRGPPGSAARIAMWAS